MKYNRRTFVKTGALALTGTAVLGNTFCTSGKKTGAAGLQLYSIRDDMLADPVGSLKKLAAMGYVNIEHAGYSDRLFYGFPAAEFRKITDDLGLKMISGHVEFVNRDWDREMSDFSDRWKYTVEDAAIMGQNYVVTPWLEESIRASYDEFRYFMDVYNRCGELCRKAGMKFGYHNHDFEFSQKFDGRSLFDIMMESIDPEMVVVQLDTGNLFGGGAVAMDVVNRYPGRFENVHVKDVLPAGGDGRFESTIIGEGIADVRNVLDKIKETGGAQTVIIEQESYQDKTALECAERNLEILRSWGY